MGTLSGLRTRRYHGLLTVAASHPGDRRVALVSLDPAIEINGTRHLLGTQEWTSGAISPAGHLLLESFTLDTGLPIWRWRIGETVLERRLAMVRGRPAVGVTHRLLAGPPVTLTVAAVGTWRDAHGERYATGPELKMQPVADGVIVDGAYRLAGPGFKADGTWYVGAHLREEAARGLTSDEDLWSIGSFTAMLEPGQTLEVTAWADDPDTPPPAATEIIEAAATRNRAIIIASGAGDDVDAQLTLAADAFVLCGVAEAPGATSGPDVVAGYPWFGAWSRDTMISYEGLFLTARRADAGREVLRRHAATLSRGMLANAAGAAGEPVDYHSIDAPLWFIDAVGRHVAATGDTDLAAELLPALRSVIDAYSSGTRYGIGLTGGGLIAGGAPDTSLTWMDARVDGVPVTSRWGSPVEINALWINALGTIDVLSAQVAGPGRAAVDSYDDRRNRAIEAFAAAYAPRPGAAPGSLPDVVRPGEVDLEIRPNQVLAYALPLGPLHGHPVPPIIGSELLTPLGLRTLAPSERAYRGDHAGGPAERDRAYHQGTVWPWLLGPYVQARLAAGQPVRGLLDGIAGHLGEYGIGSISETLSGDAPHRGTGCPFQAWSVAQVWTAYRAAAR